MSIRPILAARIVMRKLTRAGFRFIYTKSSHYFFHHPLKNRITSVPLHGGVKKISAEIFCAKSSNRQGYRSKSFSNFETHLKLSMVPDRDPRVHQVAAHAVAEF